MVNITGQSCPDGRMKSCTDITGTADWLRRRSWTGCLTARRFLLMYNTQLETFLVAADLGSFNKAAEALYISAPAWSFPGSPSAPRWRPVTVWRPKTG